MLFSCPRKLNVPDGMNWVMKITTSSSFGSIQNAVLAAPRLIVGAERKQRALVLREIVSEPIADPVLDRMLEELAKRA